jgi:hypothetical protein
MKRLIVRTSIRVSIPSFVRSVVLVAFLAASASLARAQTFTPFCFGTAQACPCGNAGGPGQGCMNSFLTGAQLSGTGTAQVSNDTVELTVTGMPIPTTVVFFQGNAEQNGGMGTVLGDGLLCVNSGIVRLGATTGNGGTAMFGHGVPGDQPISLLGMVNGHSGTKYYQAWYRNTASFCEPEGYNTSNGLAILWTP